MHRIEIKNFGPVKDCNFEMKNLNFFIGPQASGKSTICKCVYFFKSIRDEFFKFILNAVNSRNDDIKFSDFNRNINKDFTQLFEGYSQGTSTQVDYIYYDNISITATPVMDKQLFRLSFSNELKRKLIGLIDNTKIFVEVYKNREKEAMEDSTKHLSLQFELDSFFQKIRDTIGIIMAEKKELVYIPATRSSHSRTNNKLVSATPTFDKYEDKKFNIEENYFTYVEKIKNKFNKPIEKVLDEEFEFSDKPLEDCFISKAVEIIRKLLKGDYRNISGTDYIIVDSDRKVKLKNTSSGQQEAIWIAYIALYLLIKRQNLFLVIEEPEANIFPDAQFEIVKLIALLNSSTESEIIVTTHSPYILTSSNNLLYAGKVGLKKSEVDKIINREFWIYEDNASAYYVGYSKDEYFKSIIDKEFGITAEEIDKVSTSINKEYSKIFDLEVNDEQ